MRLRITAAVITQRCASRSLRAASRQPTVNRMAATIITIREMSDPSGAFDVRNPDPAKNEYMRHPLRAIRRDCRHCTLRRGWGNGGAVRRPALQRARVRRPRTFREEIAAIVAYAFKYRIDR